MKDRMFSILFIVLMVIVIKGSLEWYYAGEGAGPYNMEKLEMISYTISSPEETVTATLSKSETGYLLEYDRSGEDFLVEPASDQTWNEAVAYMKTVDLQALEQLSEQTDDTCTAELSLSFSNRAYYHVNVQRDPLPGDIIEVIGHLEEIMVN